MLHDGLYEQVINKGLDSELVSADKLSQTAPIDTAEASKVLAKYVAEVVERGLDNLRDNGGDINAQVALANQIITTIQAVCLPCASCVRRTHEVFNYKGWWHRRAVVLRF